EFAPVWQQSLFSPDRKPEAHAASGGSSLGDLALTGIILTPQLHMALLHDKNGNKELRLREGQSLPDGSLSLVEVKPRSVILDSAQGRTELKLPAGAPIDAAKAVPPTAASAMAADPMGAPRGDAGTPGGGAMQQVVPMGQGACASSLRHIPRSNSTACANSRPRSCSAAPPARPRTTKELTDPCPASTPSRVRGRLPAFDPACRASSR